MSDSKIFADDLLLPQNMLKLYSMGAFPMAKSKFSEKIEWFMPPIRAVIPLHKFNIPRSLKKIIDKNNYEVKFDSATMKVVNNCRKREESWISPKLIKAYKNLFELGHLHSVEVYFDGELSGGLYGLVINGAFFGESMFSLKPQASKIALAHLLFHLKEKKFLLLDIQYITEHLKMFGAIEISFERYNIILKEANARVCRF